MSTRNPFREENESFETVKGESLFNIRSQKIVRIPDQQGNIQEHITESNISAPDGQGGYVDVETINPIIDRAGNPMPADPQSMMISHSGLFIPSPEYRDFCSSIFHPFTFSNSNIIFLGQDGRKTQTGAICSRCQAWLNTIILALCIFGIGAVYGLFKGVGYF